MDPLDIQRFMVDLEDAVRQDQGDFDLSSVIQTIQGCIGLTEDIQFSLTDEDSSAYSTTRALCNELEELLEKFTTLSKDYSQSTMVAKEGVEQYFSYQRQESFKKRKRG